MKEFFEFKNITQAANISDVGKSWETAFGDRDGDGWVDLWFNNHLGIPKPYLKQHNGILIDIRPEVLASFGQTANHGAAWADFEHDGDQDPIPLTGAEGGQSDIPKFLSVNEAGTLWDRTATYNLDYPQGQGRMPLGLNPNPDGIGFRLFATAGGTTQRRKFKGGTHSQVQSHGRLYFGLGQPSTVNRIPVRFKGVSQTPLNLQSRPFLNDMKGVGTGNADLFIGVAKDEILRGLGGGDSMRGGDGDRAELLWGNEGHDVINGQGGDDPLLGRQENNQLLGGDGDDWLFGEWGNDSLSGGRGNDVFQLDPLK